ncbi:MAG: hypothetical protein M3552_01180 [Planctomycetota bacterium]|nr:hypothetical protein [Planctomycetota bacterium]
MAKPSQPTEPKSDEPEAVRVPAGAPRWVTPELIAHTLRVWQPYYEIQLIPEDALEIMMGVGRLIEVLSRGDDDEAIRRPGSGQQP